MIGFMQNAELVNTVEAAKMLGVDRSTVTRWVNSGRLEPVLTVPGYRGNFLFAPETLAGFEAEPSA